MRSGLKTITGFSIIGTMSLIGMVGCGGEQPPAPAESETTARPAASSTGVTIPSDVATATPQAISGANPAENPALAGEQIPAVVDLSPLLKYDSQRPLIGSWLGVAHMDPEVLPLRLEKAEGAEREELTKIARTFASYQIAMDLYSDGRMGGVIQGFINNQEVLQELTGTWTVVEQTPVESGIKFVVETTEIVTEGEPLKNQIVMIISEDHQRLVRPYESDPRLMVCEPKFVFDRIPENYTQQVANAQQSSETQTK